MRLLTEMSTIEQLKAPFSEREPPSPTIAIIGSGFSGLALGIQLQKAGFNSLTIYEKAASLGGTWRDNTYPGATCDIPSFLYSFSFEPKTDWSRKWSPQPEILDYMEHCAAKHQLHAKIRFNCEVRSARFDASRRVWDLEFTDGSATTAQVLISSVGQLSRSAFPDIPGREDFAKTTFHSARWNHDHDLSGETVGVIGSAASAIQFIPEIAKRARKIVVFQRSANWILRRNDITYSAEDKRKFAASPMRTRLYRAWIWFLHEMRYPLFARYQLFIKSSTKLALQHLEKEITDPTLRAALTPDYPIGAKRLLISDDYYPALCRENVELVTERVDHIESDSVLTTDGRKRAVDTLIFATGFDSTSFLVPMKITGKGGMTLEQQWQNGAEAHLGITVPGFPNFFMTYGPNTNIGHNSIIFMIECQTDYILQCIKKIAEPSVETLELRQEVFEDYNRELVRQLDQTVWATIRKSWYKTDAGKITNNWARSTARYWWETRRVKFDRFIVGLAQR